ncbi:amino acid adenylation domain-containing protein [Streptomyces olivaceoviridis]|uniref:amino acid adenylation domain-containing protein n=1 Tax=Streptomyces olivaceoviridis TaxID=1921 RepID=UPI0036CE54C0
MPPSSRPPVPPGAAPPGGPPETARPIRITGSPAALAVHRDVNRTAVAYPRDRSVPELFEACAARWPDAPAVVHGGLTLTYRALDRRANALAWRLAEQGVRPGAVVGVCVARSPELIVTLLAVLKCGGAYLPVDAAWPDERLHQLLTGAECAWMVTDRESELDRRLSGCRVVAVTGDDPAGRDTGPAVAVPADALAYVNFTSGSTGRPKGVAIRHRGIARLVYGARYAPLDRTSRLLQLAPVTFDAATFEIWGALLHGGTCVLYPHDFVRLSRLGQELRRHRVTVLFLTTALFNTVLDEAPDALAEVGTLLTGGEPHSVRHLAAALDRFGPGRLVHVYGPTEATTFATYHRVDSISEDSAVVPIGRPIQNTRLYVVDGGELCAPGAVGEICLAGDGLAAGYLGMPEPTAEKFVDAVVDSAPERLYRTGDFGYLLPDGRLVFHGREDDQVKINGFRIELGEITHQLDRHPAVRRSYATVTTRGEKALVAFVVPDAPVTEAELRAHLRARLPGYMVPHRIHTRDRLPLTPTGKTDRHALLATHEAAPRPC